MNIGVLALQGAIREHLHLLSEVGSNAYPVKYAHELNEIDGLVIPGGESTTMWKLMREYHLVEPIKELFRAGKPIWGTCAGLILIAKDEEGEVSHLGILDAHVKRNAFGRQKESFETSLKIKDIAEHFEAIFIRAPSIVWADNRVEVLARAKDQIVAVQQGMLLGTAFHPELTGDMRLHAHFASMVEESLRVKGNK